MTPEHTEQDEDQRQVDLGDEEMDREEHQFVIDQAHRMADAIIGATADYDAALKANGIHVGRGSPPICAVDDEAWPCAHARRMID